MKILNLHTDGGQYYISGGTTEYVGYYNTDGTFAYSGRSFDETSVSLVPIPSNTVAYNAVVKSTLPSPVTIFVPSPTDADYKQGWFIRYFARQTNMIDAVYSEIDEPQYDEIIGGQKPFYVAVQLRWKVSGPMHDIVDNITQRVVEPGVASTNDRSIKFIENSHPTLRNRLQNLVEFWNGGKEPYFAPSLVAENGILKFGGK